MSDVLKELLANPGGYGGSRDASQIKYLVFHNTGNDGDKTADNAACFRNHVVEASAHYFGCRSLAACPRSEGGGGKRQSARVSRSPERFPPFQPHSLSGKSTRST